MSDPQQDWRYRLRSDPARWLLDEADDPSVAFWFQRDIVGRPEDAPSLLDLREQILFSDPVQALFAAQDESGFWESPTSLELPRYKATLWSLALLAELGTPRASRHARAACEFVLQNHLNADDEVTGLLDRSHNGLLVRSLVYFRYGGDPRLTPALDGLAADAAAGNLFALWAFAELRNAKYALPVTQGVEQVLDGLADDEFTIVGAFPPFEPHDAVLALRVVRSLGRAHDSRLDGITQKLWDQQEEGGRWHLEKSYEGTLATDLGGRDHQTKWATLNVLRVVTE